MGYLYETHLHTCEASACASAPGRSYISWMKERGYAGIIVTDHFFNGNSCIDRGLPWKKKARLYLEGFRNAQEEAREQDFDVFFGIEYNFEGDEYLLYGVTPEWMTDFCDLDRLGRTELASEVHRAGGILIHAHPYRERGYLDTIHLTPGIADGIEIYNSGNKPYMNALAREYALSLGLPMTAGSDIHHVREGESGGMLFEERLTSSGDYAGKVLQGKGTPVILTEDHSLHPVTDFPEQCRTEEKPYLPVKWH